MQDLFSQGKTVFCFAGIAPTELKVDFADVARKGILGTKSRPSGREGLFLGWFQHRAMHFNLSIGTTNPAQILRREDEETGVIEVAVMLKVNGQQKK